MVKCKGIILCQVRDSVTMLYFASDETGAIMVAL